MVYIYKKKVSGKNYYYLRASEKKNNRFVSKDIAYLGTSIEEVKNAINTLSKYKDRIRKSYKTIHNFIESNYYLEKVKESKLKKDPFLRENLENIEACYLHFNSKFKKKNELTKKEVWQNFIIEFAFNSTSIEGNTITLKEARNLFTENLTPKNKTLREVYDLQNTNKVFFKLLESNKEITHELIINTHKDLMKNIDNRVGYRTEDVRVFKSRFKSTPAPYVKTDMNLLLNWYNNSKLHPFVIAVIFHHKFEKVHPFMDGNGRTGRMLMNYILLRKGYPPLVMQSKKRKKYLDMLSNADKSTLTKNEVKYYKDLIDFSAKEMIKKYWDIFL